MVAFGLLVGAATAPARAQSDPHSRKEKVAGEQAAVATQIDVLSASAADVQARLSGLQGTVAAAEGSLADAQQAVDVASGALDVAIEHQASAQRQVEERQRRLRDIAVVSYVNADARTMELAVALEEPTGDVDQRVLREALAGFRANEDGLALQRLQAAQAELRAATDAAQAAANEAASRQANALAQAETLRVGRDEQASFAASVEQRLDDKLAEATALRSLDRTLSDQIATEERALAAQVTPTATLKARPAAPAAPVVVPPPPARPDLVTTHGVTVAGSIADRLGAMIDAAAADGITLTGSGFRSYDSQVALRRQNCGPTDYDVYQRPPSQCSPPTARPGRSNHEQGLAVDLAANGRAIVSHSDAGWTWLAARAGAFGFYNLSSEPWHWSVDGM
ncbi:MAG: D-alanyl-D-alanine carboxypeptidase family protein [Acidimicrobiales bacterium]